MATSRKIALLFAAENVNAIIGWVALLFVARKMGASVLGEFSFALSLVGSFTFIAFFGFKMAHVKRISEGLDLGKCIGTFLSVRLFLISLMLITFITSYWFWTGFLDKEIYDIQTPGLLLTVVCYYIVFLIVGVMPATFSGLEQGARVAIPNIIGTTLRSLIFIVVALTGLGVIWLARAYLIGIVVIGLLSFWYFRDFPISKPDAETFNSYKVYALPVAAASVFGVLKQYVDKIFIGIFWTQYQVGLYFGVQRIALFIGTMALAIEAMLLPAISNLHANRKENEIKALVHDAERYVAMVCIPLVVMTVVWSSEIILVFISKEFIPASNILKILALVALVRVLNRPWSIALRGSDRPDLTSILNVLTSILSIILMLVLVPKRIPQLGLENLFGLGGEGAAYAALISEIVGGLSLRLLSYKYLEILPKSNFFVQLIVATIVGSVMWQVQGVITVDRWFELFFLSGLGGLLFLCILAMIGSFTQKDFNFFWTTLNPKSMKQYVGEELKR
jgi:O-antigen/teichoic acid export membrane protein|tara:strand:- start:1930 stop:3447 length:1518 start_codon:yes stop_codon:yes gene_type:complete